MQVIWVSSPNSTSRLCMCKNYILHTATNPRFGHQEGDYDLVVAHAYPVHYSDEVLKRR